MKHQRPTPIPVGKLRYLSAAMHYQPTAGAAATCIQRCVALCLDLPAGLLTFGTFRAATAEEQVQLQGKGSPIPFIHAWVEWQGWVYAPTTVERTENNLVAWYRDEYLRANGASNVRHVPRRDFDRIAKHWGLASALKHKRDRFGNGMVSDDLLNAAGVKYRINEHRAVLPLESDDETDSNP